MTLLTKDPRGNMDDTRGAFSSNGSSAPEVDPIDMSQPCQGLDDNLVLSGSTNSCRALVPCGSFNGFNLHSPMYERVEETDYVPAAEKSFGIESLLSADVVESFVIISNVVADLNTASLASDFGPSSSDDGAFYYTLN